MQRYRKWKRKKKLGNMLCSQLKARHLKILIFHDALFCCPSFYLHLRSFFCSFFLYQAPYHKVTLFYYFIRGRRRGEGPKSIVKRKNENPNPTNQTLFPLNNSIYLILLSSSSQPFLFFFCRDDIFIEKFWPITMFLLILSPETSFVPKFCTTLTLNPARSTP